MWSAAIADRYRVDFSIDAYFELPASSGIEEIPATWDLEVYYDPDRRRYDLFTTLGGDGVHAESVHERAGHGVDDAGLLEGYARDRLTPEVQHSLKVHPNDFRIERGPNNSYFRLRPEHKGPIASKKGKIGRHTTTFKYEPSDVANSTLSPDGDVDGDGTVDFADFLILSTNFARRDRSFTYKDGDFNYDNRVDFADFVVLSANFGAGTAHAVSVPEPMGWVPILFGFGLLRRRRCR